MEITLFVPPELEKNAQQIKRFFDAMLFKLRKNAHKPSFERSDAQHCLTRIVGETDELRQAIEEGNSVEVLLEGADVANFALLAATSAIDRDGKGEGGQDPHHDAPIGRDPWRVEVLPLVVRPAVATERPLSPTISADQIAVETISMDEALGRAPAVATESPEEPALAPDGASGPPDPPAPVPEAPLVPPVAPEGEDTGRVRYDAAMDPTLLHSETSSRESVRALGFTGDICSNCMGSHMQVAGHCLVCSDCGTTTGCS